MLTLTLSVSDCAVGFFMGLKGNYSVSSGFDKVVLLHPHTHTYMHTLLASVLNHNWLG